MIVGAEQERAAGYGPMANGVAMMQENIKQMFSGPTVPNPQDVADAVAALIDTPAGTRPARVVVDQATGAMTESLNKAHCEIQTALLNAFGMGMLADK
jgi:hypothetical protein